MNFELFVKFISQTSTGNNVVFVDLDGTLHLGKYPKATDSYSNADLLRLIYLNLILKKPKYYFLHYFILIFSFLYITAKFMQLLKLINLNTYERIMIMFFHYLITPFISDDELLRMAGKTVSYAYPKAFEVLKYLSANHYEIVLITKAHSFIAKAYSDILFKRYGVSSMVYANPHIKNFDQRLKILNSFDKFQQAEIFLRQKTNWNRIIILGNGKDDLGMMRAALKHTESKKEIILVSVGKDEDIQEYSQLHIDNFDAFTPYI